MRTKNLNCSKFVLFLSYDQFFTVHPNCSTLRVCPYHQMFEDYYIDRFVYVPAKVGSELSCVRMVVLQDASATPVGALAGAVVVVG
jgi:hypothetical protein